MAGVGEVHDFLMCLANYYFCGQVRGHSENIMGGGGSLLRGNPDFAIYWRGAQRFCQILIIKET